MNKQRIVIMVIWVLTGLFIMTDFTTSAEERFASDVFGGFLPRTDGEFCCQLPCQGCLPDHSCQLVGTKCVERVQLGINKACFEVRGPGCSSMDPCFVEEVTGIGGECQDIVTAEVPPGGCSVDACVSGSSTTCGTKTTCSGD